MYVGVHDNLFIIHLYIYIYFIYIYLYIHYIYLCGNVLSMYVGTYKMRMKIMSFFQKFIQLVYKIYPILLLENAVLLQKSVSLSFYQRFTSIFKELSVREKERIICNAHNPACSIYLSLSIFFSFSLYKKKRTKTK